MIMYMYGNHAISDADTHVSLKRIYKILMDKQSTYIFY